MSEIHSLINKTTDPEGIQWFKEWLDRKGFTNITIPQNEFSYYDIEADKGDKHYIFELKSRPCTSYAFNDSIIELQKFNILKQFSGEKYVVNFFTDCFHIHELGSQHEFQDHFAQATNNWNRNKIRKVLVSYKNTNKSRKEYDQ